MSSGLSGGGLISISTGERDEMTYLKWGFLGGDTASTELGLDLSEPDGRNGGSLMLTAETAELGLVWKQRCECRL